MATRNITVQEAALRLGKSVATVRRLLAAGELPGQKIGGRWLVHGDKLATRRLSSTTAKAPSASIDVEAALRHVLRSDRRELWVPDVLMWEDFRSAPANILASASSKCSTGTPDPVEMVEVPKGELLSRAGTLLTLEDRVAYHALCASFADQIEAKLSENVFSSRRNDQPSGDFFKSGVRQWTAFHEAVAAAVPQAGSWQVETDLVSYFETISHQLLFEDLQSLGVPGDVTQPLRALLREWRRTSRHGLPIGMDASRLLGNFFMARVDEIMLAEGYSYWRFMDDIRILAPTQRDALAGLRRFEVLCRERGLIISGAKTRVAEFDPSAVSEDDTRIDRADYFLRNGFGQSRAVLRELFGDALAERKVKTRHAKFALLRLGALVDRGVLSKIMNRLDALKETSPESAFYLRAFVSEKKVQSEITKYLARRDEPGIEVHQQVWLIAAMLEVLNEPPKAWIDYARTVALDANNPTFLRGLAMNLLAIGRNPIDVDRLKELAQRNYDPGLVRSAAAALQRIGALDKNTQQQILHRHPSLAPTVDYLAKRGSLPSLVQEGLWSSVRKMPAS
jgi:excisionase family DNA binding protein